MRPTARHARPAGRFPRAGAEFAFLPRLALLLFVFELLPPAARASGVPQAPTQVQAYSDYLTPTSVRLTWVDPTQFTGGEPLASFDIRITRNGTALAPVASGVRLFVDTGRQDGVFYTYEVRAHDLADGTDSAPVTVSAWAGGDPVPGPVTSAVALAVPNSSTYRLRWRNPSVQRDGTPLDDFNGLKIYKNGFQVSTIVRAASAAGLLDSLVVPFDLDTDYYEISAFDREAAHNESVRSPRLLRPDLAPRFSVTPSSLLLGTTWQGPVTAQDLTIANSGTGILTVVLAESAPWLTLDAATLNVEAGSQALLRATADPAGLAPGTYNTTISMTTNDTTHPVHDLAVQFVIGVPTLTLDTLPIEVTVPRHAPAAVVTRLLGNSGAGVLNFTVGDTAPWLFESATSGSLVANATQLLAFSFSSAGLSPGSYADSLVILANDPTLPRSVIPARMEVTVVPPDAQVLPGTIDVAQLRYDAPITRDLTLTNAGWETLEISAITHAAPWLNLDGGPLSLAHGAALRTITLDGGGLAAGTYTDTLGIASNDPQTPLLRIPVNLVVTTAPPLLDVSPTTLSATVLAGGAAVTRNVGLSNLGNEPLHWSLSAPPAWLSRSAAAGTLTRGQNTVVTFTLDPAGLPPGTYTATQVLSSDDPARPATPISVTLVVLPLGFLIFEPDTMSAVLTGNGAAQLDVTMANGGGTAVTWTVAAKPVGTFVTPTSGSVPATSTANLHIVVNSTGRSPGQYPLDVQVNTSDPGHPSVLLHIDLLVLPVQFHVEPAALSLAVPWRAEPVARSLVFHNDGTGGLTVGLVGGNPWLLAEAPPSGTPLAAGDSLVVPVTLDPRDRAPGVYLDYLAPLVFEGSTPLVPVTLTVTASPPDLQLFPAALTARRAAGSGMTRLSLAVTNAGYQPLTYAVSPAAAWLTTGGGAGTLGAGATDFVAVTLNAAGLPPGDYSTSLTVTSDDADTPTRLVPVTLTVTPAESESPPTEIAVTEVGFRCANGDSTPQYLVLAARGAGRYYRASYGLRITDRDGVVRLDRTDLFPGHLPGEAWPDGRPWLVAGAAFTLATGLAADLAVAPLLDPRGGTVTLYDGTPATVLHRFAWGGVGGVNAPAPGHALRLQPDGRMREAVPPAPRNAAGQSVAAWNCPCPASDVTVGQDHYVTYAPLFDATGSGGYGGAQARATFDLAAGRATLTVDRTDGQVITTHRLVLGGAVAGQPLAFLAQARAELSVVAPPTFDRRARAWVELRRLPAGGVTRFERAIRNTQYPYSNLQRPLVNLFLEERALEPFDLAVELGGSGASEGGSAAITTQIDFLGLPAGVTITSCQGWREDEPTPIEVAVVSAAPEGDALRLEWRVPSDSRAVTIYRRDAGEPSTAWRALGLALPDAAGRLVYRDATVAPGARYDYRLGLGDLFAGFVTVDVPVAAGALRVTLPAVWRGPGAPELELELPAAAAVTLRLFDVRGGLRHELPLGALPAGRHHLALDAARGLASGLYFLRASTEEPARREAAARLLVIR